MNKSHQLLEKQFKLSDEQIHVFLFQLDLLDFNEFMSCLSDDELERADRLRVEEKKKQFVIARAALRKLLASCLNVTAKEILITFGEHCKPYVLQKYNNQTIEFNISHSGNYVLIAMTLNNKIGIDIEKINNDIDYQSLSKRFFSEKEKQELSEIEETEQLNAFYRVWVRKESFTKAIGKGIAFGLDQFSVSLSVNDKTIIDMTDSKISDEQCYCYNLMSIDGYKTALTCYGKLKEVIIFQ